MSGFSDSTICPNCGASCDEYQDHKPFSHTIITCYECGLIIQPEISYMDLEELNERREELDLEKLIQLPKQEGDLW